MKQSKLRRKYVNAMDSMADVPKPARRFKYPPTLSAPITTTAKCPKLLDVRPERRGRVFGFLRKPGARAVVCGAPLALVPFEGRTWCARCARADAVVTKDLERMGYRKLGRRALARSRSGKDWTETLIEHAVAKAPWTAEAAGRRRAARARQAASRIFSRRKV